MQTTYLKLTVMRNTVQGFESKAFADGRVLVDLIQGTTYNAKKK